MQKTTLGMAYGHIDLVNVSSRNSNIRLHTEILLTKSIIICIRDCL